MVRYQRASGNPVEWGRLALLTTRLPRGLTVLVAALGLQLALAQAQPTVTFERLKSFGFADQSGASPEANLLQGRDGALYGTTFGGGNNNNGTVFKLNPDGSGYTVIKTFIPGCADRDGAFPYAALALGSDGALYGTTDSGGSADLGTVFKLNPDGSGYMVLKSFTYFGRDGTHRRTALGQDSDGAL